MLSETKSRYAGKNLSMFFIAFLLLQFNTLAQQGWFWQNPLPQGKHLSDIYVFDENKAIAVGGAGTVLVDDEIGPCVLLVGGLGFVPAIHAAPSLLDSAVFPAPSLLAGRHLPVAIQTLVRTGAAISRFSSIGFGTPLIHDDLPDDDTTSLSRRCPADNNNTKRRAHAPRYRSSC